MGSSQRLLDIKGNHKGFAPTSVFLLSGTTFPIVGQIIAFQKSDQTWFLKPVRSLGQKIYLTNYSGFSRAICHPTPPETLGIFQVDSSQRSLDIIGPLSLMSI